ncbi:hypothetical protein FRC09_016181, partial [Ceratobasidium sp. 395]
MSGWCLGVFIRVLQITLRHILRHTLSSTISKLLVQLSTQIAEFSQLLNQISDADYAGGLNPAATNTLDKLLGKDKSKSLTALRSKVMSAKKKLKEVQLKKRKSRGPGKPGAPKEPKTSGEGKDEPDTGDFWHDSFIEELAGLTKTDVQTPEEFFEDLVYANQEVQSFVDKYAEEAVLGHTLKAFQSYQATKLTGDHLAKLYLAMEPKLRSPLKQQTM